MRLDNNQKAFLALLRAGLWEEDVRLSSLDDVDYTVVSHLAEEQSVVGLLAAGIEHVIDIKPPQIVALTIVGSTLQLEQRNRAMNAFVSRLVEFLRSNDIYSLLVKGQGIAQCYERPLWRASGDVDLFLNANCYQKAKGLLVPISKCVEKEHGDVLHIAMEIESYEVELHGSLRCRLGKKIDKVIDAVQYDCFYHGNVRTWQSGETTIFLPSCNNDVIIIFTHILKHFFKGGIGIRQICDLNRLLWKYKDEIDISLLDLRLKKMGLLSEWKAFAALSVEYLGLPVNAMPLYSSNRKWSKKAKSILDNIMTSGNFGHNRDRSYEYKYPYLIRKTISFCYHSYDSLKHFFLFPIDSIRIWCLKVLIGLKMLNESV